MMAEITASMVKSLRDKTDAPMMECKKALTEAIGDLEKAEEILRIKLGSKAGKTSTRINSICFSTNKNNINIKIHR